MILLSHFMTLHTLSLHNDSATLANLLPMTLPLRLDLGISNVLHYGTPSVPNDNVQSNITHYPKLNFDY